MASGPAAVATTRRKPEGKWQGGWRRLPCEPNKIKELPSRRRGTGESISAHNWLDCMRSRKTPNADVMSGYFHSVACIMSYHQAIAEELWDGQRKNRETPPSRRESRRFRLAVLPAGAEFAKIDLETATRRSARNPDSREPNRDGLHQVF